MTTQSKRICARSFSHVKAIMVMLVLNIYDYTFDPTLDLPSANSGSLRQSTELRGFLIPTHAEYRNLRSDSCFAPPVASNKLDFSPDNGNIHQKSGCKKGKLFSLCSSELG